MLDSGRDRLALLRVCSEEAGNGIGGVVGHRAAVQSGDCGVRRRELERGRGGGRRVAADAARVAGALPAGGLGRVGRSLASDAVVSASGGGGGWGGGVGGAGRAPREGGGVGSCPGG